MADKSSSLPLETLYELRVKHLEMIQAVIGRLAGYGATLKNYCITLVTAICGWALSVHEPALALLSVLPIVVFALLDAKYLCAERDFRALFDSVRLEEAKKAPTFEIKSDSEGGGGVAEALFSWSICGFYLPVLVGVLAIFFLIEKYNG